MGTTKLPLEKLRHEFDKHEIDAGTGLTVFHASSSHSLTQAAGYLKYVRANEAGKGVFFRGQAKLYKTLSPALLRGATDGPKAVSRRAKLDALLATIEAKGEALRAVNPDCREALLQHYGIKTTWLDVVDNLWVALWFACHEARSPKSADEYLHFEKRLPRSSATAQFCYVLLVESAYFSPVNDRPGHYRDPLSETIDLRTAAPSHFVRPHAQHGMLVRRLSKKSGLPKCDFGSMLVGIIRVNLADALDWLGSASTLTSHALFPPAFYDYGYRELLEYVHTGDKSLGAINRVQP